MQSNDLMISVSGVRGIVGRSLTPELLVRLGHAFGTYLRSGRVVVGRDTRASGEMAKHAVLGGLLASGCQVLDAGVCATPTATLMVEAAKAAGGVMVTASHNPIEWNALKFFRADGVYLNADESRDLLNIYYGGQFAHAEWNQLHAIESLRDTHTHHVSRVLELIDADLIRSKRFHVALDGCGGAGCAAAQLLLDELNCRYETIHCRPDGRFPRRPEPTAANLRDLCELVRRTGAQAGFALDPDADRVAFVDEQGICPGEEAGLALATRHILQTHPRSGGPVVINLSTSRMTEDVARTLGREVLRTPCGEVHVAEKMKEVGAVFGGEGNGGIIDPRLHRGRDSIIGIGLMLECMARTERPLSQLFGALPAYHMVKNKVDCPPNLARRIIRALKADAGSGRVDTRDGLRLDWDDRWVQLRASNTEPIIRILAEARSPSEAQGLAERYLEMIQNLRQVTPAAETVDANERGHAA